MAHRLLMLGCRTMREGVLVSAIFFVAAILLFLAVQHVIPAIAVVQHVVLLLALGPVACAGAGELPTLIAEIHRRQTGVIAAGIDSSQSIARLWGCGVDYIQGDFLQLPARELSFDFSETPVQ